MIWDSLTPQQMKGARLEAMGNRPVDIAREIGVRPHTISAWRRLPAYRETVALLSRAATARALDDAALSRTRLIRLGLEALDIAQASIKTRHCDECGTDVAQDAKEAAAVSKAALDWYRTLSAQTGLTEATKSEVEVSLPDEARRRLREELRDLDLAALEAAAERVDKADGST